MSHPKSAVMNHGGPGVGPGGPNAGAPEQQAKEKLAVYVYEYLMHAGAQKSAATFLEEMFRDKTIRIGPHPGFLQTWWSVFWDLYCAAPEHREQPDLCSSSEARAFYDLGMVSSGHPVGPGGPPGLMGPPMPGPPQDNMPPGSMMPPGHPPFFNQGSGPPQRCPPPPQQPLMPSGPRHPGIRQPMGRGAPMPIQGDPNQPIFLPDVGMPYGMPPQGHPQRFPPITGSMGPGPGMVNMSGPGPRGMMIGGPPGGPPSEGYRAWPTTSLSPAAGGPPMSNGPMPPHMSGSTPIIPSPHNVGHNPGSVGTPSGGPGSVGGANPLTGPSDMTPITSAMSPDYTNMQGNGGQPNFIQGAVNGGQGHPPGSAGNGGPGQTAEDAEAIARIKDTLGAEAKHFETGDTPRGAGTPTSTDYFMS